jgi:hypothetical protein
MDMVITAACHLRRTWAFKRATSHKWTKYGPAVHNGMITKVIPFIVSPFSVLTTPAKAFLKWALSKSTSPKLTKARLHLALVVVHSMAKAAVIPGIVFICQKM